MLEATENAAGELWRYLNANGESSMTKIGKDTGLTSKDLQRAVGWLAREDKLVVNTKGRSEYLALK